VACLDPVGAHERDVLADERRVELVGEDRQVVERAVIGALGTAERQLDAVRDDLEPALARLQQRLRRAARFDVLGDDLDEAEVGARDQAFELRPEADAEAEARGRARSSSAAPAAGAAGRARAPSRGVMYAVAISGAATHRTPVPNSATARGSSGPAGRFRRPGRSERCASSRSLPRAVAHRRLLACWTVQ